MLKYEDTSIVVNCQGFRANGVEYNLERNKSVFMFLSERKTETVQCPYCGEQVYEHGLFTYTLRDMPIIPKVEQYLHFQGHRYQCRKCHHTFNEEIPYKYAGTRITNCAAAWVKSLIHNKNNLVEKYLPNAAIVYDRYHMQAQYGKDVLGVVRLAEARKHKEAAKQLQEKGQEDKAARRQTRQKIKQEQEQYSKLKKSRWTLLMNGAHLSKEGQTHLDNILRDHADLAICYAMKEEMIHFFDLRNTEEAYNRWYAWFESAKPAALNRWSNLLL